MAVDAARTDEGFTSAGAARVLRSACRTARLDDRGAELIRLGENALFRLASVPVVVRIARGKEWLSTARKEVAVARWLAAEGFSPLSSWLWASTMRQAAAGNTAVPGA